MEGVEVRWCCVGRRSSCARASFFFSVSADGVLCNSNCATVSVVSCLISDYHLCPMRIPFRSRLCH